MMSTVGVDHTNFENSDLTWKTVSKRNRRGMRRTKESVAAISMTIGLGLANKNARKMENVTVLESERLGVDILGRHFCEKVENVPIKKRRLMFRSPSPPHPMTPCPHLEASEKHVDFQATPDQNCGSSTEQWQQLMKSDCSAKSYAPSIDDEKISDGINGVEDFSGIEILAAAACSDSICNDVTDYEGNPVVEESTQERIQSSVSSILLDETTASLETAYRFPIDSVNERKSESSSFQDNSSAFLHEVPCGKDTAAERSPLHEFPSGKGTNLSVNESKSEGSSFQDNSFAVLHKIPSDKNTTREGFIPLPDDRLLWDLNVPMDAWPCDGGNVDSQKDSVDNISVRSEEMQTMESQDIKSDTTNEVVSSDVDGGNRMTSELRSMPAGTDDLGTEKQESGYGSQYIKDDTTNGVVSSDIDGGDKMTSDLRSMPVWTDDLSVEEWQSGFDSEYLKNYTTKEVVSSDVGGDNRMTSDSRIMPVGSDNLSTDKQESEGCSGYDSRLQTKEPQDMKNETANEVVSSDVDGGNRMTSDSRTMPVGTDDFSTEKQESEGCSDYDSRLQTKEPQDTKNDITNEVVSSDVDGDNRMTSDLRTIPVGTDDFSTEKHESEGCSVYDSQFEDGELRESDDHCWEEAEQVDYDTECEEERSLGLEADSDEQELAEKSKCCETGEAFKTNSVSLKIRTMEMSSGETMKFDCLDRSNYDLRVDLSMESKKEMLSCVEGSLSSDVLKSRPANFNGSYTRAERGSGSDKFMGSERSAHMRGRSPEGARFFNPSANYWDSSKREHPHNYHGPYNFGRPRSKGAFGNREYSEGTDQAPSDAAGVARPDHRITRQFMASYRPLLRRRSPIERDDSYNMHPRVPTVADTSPDRNRFRRFSQGVSRGIREKYLRLIPDDSTQYMRRMPHRLDRRERSISPHGGRPQHAVPYERARSRSRSPSPIDWLLQRDRNEDSRRRNRSPDFRSDARMDRVRLPFSKRFAAAGYAEFISPPRSRVSPKRNSRIFEDHHSGLDHFRGRKSHVRMIQQDQRFDQVCPSRRLNSDDHFNPMIRPRRFPDKTAGGKGCKYVVNDDGKHSSSRYAMIHRSRCYDTDGGARQFRKNEEDSYMAKNSLTMTNANGVSSRHPDDADAPRTAGEDRFPRNNLERGETGILVSKCPYSDLRIPPLDRRETDVYPSDPQALLADGSDRSVDTPNHCKSSIPILRLSAFLLVLHFRFRSLLISLVFGF
ncbi:Dentin sialophosphoprotein-related, putative isoform 3 [Hibiscus syriacus]|uniref:Dentin sialophosphoprotein-related, putative isoform 3 n=1 Tax=Hibiscus syriacus TaxID=106335 RepID=A0A6A3BRS0_HIBSY|nr:Dentin sialophosphoprotein-related, putative isoform 3 [Hibiscus syriacus]